MGLQSSPAPKHGVLHLLGDHRADLAQVFSDGLNLAHGSHQKLQVIIQLPYIQVFSHRGIAELAADKVIDIDLGGALAVTVNTPVALLQAIRIPGDLVVNEAAAMVLQVNALGGSIR